MNKKITLMVVGNISQQEKTDLLTSLRKQTLVPKGSPLSFKSAGINEKSIADDCENYQVDYLVFSHIKADMLIKYSIEIKKRPIGKTITMRAFEVIGGQVPNYEITDIVCCSTAGGIASSIAFPPEKVHKKEEEFA